MADMEAQSGSEVSAATCPFQCYELAKVKRLPAIYGMTSFSPLAKPKPEECYAL